MRNHGRTYLKLTESEVLRLIKLGVYRVDPDEGRVFKADGKELHYTPMGRRGRYRCVRFHHNRQRIGIAVHRVVWMAVTGATIPEGWEIHHRVETHDGGGDGWDNLLCVHPLDHEKLHAEKG